MCRVYGIEAVFGRFASYEATGAVIEEDYSGGEQCTGYAVVSHQRKREYNLKNSLRGKCVDERSSHGRIV